MTNSDNFEDRKQPRRNKVKKQNIKKHLLDDDQIQKNKAKKEIKKIKESLDDDEWEQWDQHYNH